MYLLSIRPPVNGLFKVTRRSLYFIDFGSTRIFSSGPGSGVVIHDWKIAGGHVDPPEGSESVDPFAYDIYSLGETISSICLVSNQAYKLSPFSYIVF